MNLDYLDQEKATGFAAHYREDRHGASVELTGGKEPCVTHFAPGREDSARICYQEALEMLKSRAEDGAGKEKIEADIRELIESAKED